MSNSFTRKIAAPMLRISWPLLWCVLTISPTSALAQWTAVYRNAVELDTAGLLGIEELSGVAYVGQQTSDIHRLVAIGDTAGGLSQFDITFAADGTLQTATAVSSTSIEDTTFDSEAIAFTDSVRNSVFVAHEKNGSNQDIPSIREYDLTSGDLLLSVSLPSVWNANGNTVSNRGFESLTRMPHGKSMWTGNEEALTIDGSLATDTSGTTIRLQRMAVNGSIVTAQEQYAYSVDPIHAASTPERSGLVDLVGLPDGNLLALERSAAFTLPVFQNRIYQVDDSLATDVSTPEFDVGLVNQSFTPVAKSLVWSGAVNGLFGANLEGVTLGPRLNNGNWSLIGVVDNGGGTLGNAIVAFELIRPTAYGDFDLDGDFDTKDAILLAGAILAGTDLSSFDLTSDGIVDASDQSKWLADAARANGFAMPFSMGDANLDGVVDATDFDYWNTRRFTSTTFGIVHGDFNIDGFVDVSDFHIWLVNQSVVENVSAVPEPQMAGVWLLLCVATLARRWASGT